MTPSPDSFSSGAKARIVANGPRTLAVSTWSIRSSSKRFEVVVRHHPGEPGGIDQHVGAAVFLAHRGGDLADLRGVLERQAHRLVAAAGQLAHDRIGALDALVVADHDLRAGLRRTASRSRAPMPLLAPVMTATLPSRSLPICAMPPMLPASLIAAPILDRGRAARERYLRRELPGGRRPQCFVSDGISARRSAMNRSRQSNQ